MGIRGGRITVNGLYHHGFLIAPALAELTLAYVERGQIDGYVEACRSKSAEDIEALLASGGFDDRDWSRRTEEGSPPEAITRIAERIPTDLLVIGTHARTGLRKAIFGSVTEDVLSRAGPDVLVVPPPRSDLGCQPLLPPTAGRPEVGPSGPRLVLG